MECSCKMCVDYRHATMDLRSPSNMYRSITDVSESHSRSYASPYRYGSAYSWASSSLYQGKDNLCLKTEMWENNPRKENRRVPSMSVGSTSGPDLSSCATDDGPVITERKKNTTLFGDAAGDGSMRAEIKRKMAAEMMRKQKLLYLNGIRDLEMQKKIISGEPTEDGSLEAEIKRKILLGDATDDGSIITERKVKHTTFADADDDGSMIAVSGKKVWFADPIDDRSIAESDKKIWSDNTTDDEPIPSERSRKKKEEGRTKWWKLGIILFLLLVEFILPCCLSSLFELCLTADKLKHISEESMARRRLSDRLDFVAQKLSTIVPGQVVNCIGSDSLWKWQQDGLLVYSHCTLYSSMVEEVSLWGFPSPTTGVMGRGITDRSLTIMSGRMIQWYEGKTDYVVHQEGDSWTHEMLTASVVQMDGKTWILEYRPSAILQGGGLVSWALRSLKWFTFNNCERVRSNFRSCLLPKLNVRHTHGDLRTPT